MEAKVDLADSSENKQGQRRSSTDENTSQEIKKGHIFKPRKHDFRAEKEKYINMPLEEKRKLYSRKKQVELTSIATWEQHYKENEELGKLADILEQKAEVNDGLNEKVSIWKGDLTLLEIDAIANAAKETLLGGAGVDGAIHYAAGDCLLQECKSLGGCDTGDAKITGGYKLPAKCYKNEKAAPVAVSAVRNWLEDENNAKSVDRVIFCLYMAQDVDLYGEVMTQYFPVKDRRHPTEIECLSCTTDDEVSTTRTDVVESRRNKTRKRKNSYSCTLI